MELKGKAPKYISEEGGNGKLKDELEKDLDRELAKSPDELDSEKIDYIIHLLDKISPMEKDQEEITTELFARKYLNNYTKADKKYISASYMKALKAVAVLLLVILAVCAFNCISVKATDKNIFNFIKEKAYIIYFNVMGNAAEKEESHISEDDIQNISEMEFSSWEELQSATNLAFMIPHYIPELLEAGTIHYQGADMRNAGVSRQYFNEEYSMRFIIRTIGGNGELLTAIDKLKGLIAKEEINNIETAFYKSDDAFQAIFQDEQFIYIIETNIDLEELKQVIMKMN